MNFLIQILVVLCCLFYGARKGGIALGLLGGVGLIVLVFVFHLPPGEPPIDVMLVIIAVITASATLQTSGGLDVMLQIAERILRKKPEYITIISPFVTCTLTILCGTGHVVYTMFPIIYDIAIKNNIRPERPMAASSIASQMGIVASPVSVAVVSFVTLLAGYKIGDYNITYTGFLAVTIPSTFFGVLCVGLFSWFRGKDLEKDRSFQEFISNKDNKHYVYGSNETLIGKKLPYASRLSMYIFLSAIIIVAALGAIPALRPIIGGKALNMVLTIQLFMLLAGAIIIIFTKTKANEISKNEIFRSGMIAIVAVYGIAWMADTMFQANLPELKNILSEVVKQHPWSYALALFLVSKFVNSQAAAINALVPTALLIGVEPLYVVAFAAACYGYYILPTYPSDLAAIQFDRSGTTKIGKYVINHSFILPGLIGVIASCLMGLIIVKIVILL